MPAGTATCTMTMTTITEPAKLLRLLAWLSPAFPTGAYAYSHGLEWAVETGDIMDGPSLEHWLADVLRHGSGRNDAILARCAHRGAQDPEALAEIAAMALAMCAGAERLGETIGQGNAFLLAARPWAPAGFLADFGDIAYPVAVGALSGSHGIDEDEMAAALLQAFATNLISAAVRLVPLGQTTGLMVLAALEPVIIATAAETRGGGLDDLGGVGFRADLASLRHETQYTRLFRS
ncbi:MAG: urease accessory protein UreF [Acetobacteraceae bacterium]|nr:urease accessory protein UreF [Acetobacteraceae bacterium]